MWLSVERDELRKAEEHILEGLIIASDNDEVIALIKSSKVLKKQEEID
jgi:DNA gyrase/topoisomerase IV subunit A